MKSGKITMKLLFQKEIKQNREYISGWKNKSLSAFIIGKIGGCKHENNEKKSNS